MLFSNSLRRLHQCLFALGLFFWVSYGPLGVVFAQGGPHPSAERVTVNVGVLLSLSRGLEQWCLPIRQGMEIAAEELLGDKIKLIFEDDQSVDKRATLVAAKRLLELHKVDLLYTWTTSLAPLLVPIANQTKTPLVVGSYDPRSIKFGEYVYALGVNYQSMARDIANFLVMKGGRRFGIVMQDDHWSKGFEEPFKEELTKLGARVVLTESLPVASTDTRALVLRIKKREVDGILAPLFGETLHSFIRTARELKLQSDIHVAEGLFEDDIRIIGPSSEGVYASQIWLENKELLSKVRARFGNDAHPLQLGLIASGYDFVAHIAKTASNVVIEESTDSPQNRTSGSKGFKVALARSLMTTSSEGYLGKHYFGEPPLKSLASMVVVKDGRYRLVE